MPDGLTTAAEARELAERIVSIAADENHVVIGGYGEYETEVVARALLAALNENERLREALRWVDDMTRGRSGVSGISDYVRTALYNEAERARRAEEDFRWADPFEAER